MDTNLASDLRHWQATFKQELLAQLASLREDEDIYGFGVEVPEDLSNLGIITAIGRESRLAGEQSDSMVWLDRRYSPADWEYLPNAKPFADSCDQLEAIGQKYRDLFSTDTSEDSRAGNEFRDALYTACLDTMAQCDAAGAFDHIWFKIIFLSDGEHPIVRQSFNRLNTGRAKKEARLLYNGPPLLSKIAHQLWMLYVRKIRSRKYRRKSK